MFNFWPFVTRYGQLTQAIDMCEAKAQQHESDAKRCPVNGPEACQHYACAQENRDMSSYLTGLRDGFKHGKLFG